MGFDGEQVSDLTLGLHLELEWLGQRAEQELKLQPGSDLEWES